MNDIRIVSLYSGSSGNSFLIKTPDVAVLIDAGKNAKQLSQALSDAGVCPEEIRAIFVTHEHNDHISALPVFLKRRTIPVHLPQGCVYKLSGEPTLSERLCAHPPMHTEVIGSMSVTSFPTPHDSRASVGYRIEITSSERARPFCIGYATDIGYVSREVETALMGCDAVILESNHDVDMLMSGIYPDYLKQRIFSRRGHLSNPESAVFAARLCQNGTKSLMLAHLSRENNTPDIALDECMSAVGDDRVHITVASPDSITEMIL